MYTDAIGPDGIHHGSAEVVITRKLPHRVNGHYSLNYVYTSLKKEILNAFVADRQSIEDVVESWNFGLGK